ncbi:MAG: EamA family transporter [Lentisphaeria bacterium]|nr:EamA family transporter [Lentisphaeria bacterium]
MTPLVFFLILTSASVHVGWNALGKRSNDKVAFALGTLLVSTLLLAPVFVIRRLASPGVWTGEALLCVVVSGLFEALYFALLFSAYQHVDLSVAYPLSRGVAPVFALIAGGLLLQDWIGPAEGVAIATILLGVGAVSLSAGQKGTRRGLMFALATGAMIAGYHVVDRRAMTLPQRPDFYEFLFLNRVFIVIFLSLILALRSGGVYKRLVAECRRAPRTVVAVGLMTPLAYFLILLALTRSNVTYVSAGRNIGIVLSTLVGKIALQEKVSRGRWAGVFLILAGIAALVFLGAH